MRALPSLGAALACEDVAFCVWAPLAESVEVVFEGNAQSFPLVRSIQDDFVGKLTGVGAGLRYQYRLDGGESYPDPCSRYQPDGVHGFSQVVDETFEWTDAGWPGVEMKGQVLYELHIGAFTPEGTFDAAIGQLDELKALGITLIEVMPVGEFPGRFNWGYDGVHLFAPYHGYGDYAAFKRFVDAAHRRGLGVILDVVYNHLGPDGNYLPRFSADYFSARHRSEWGETLNFDGPGCGPVRHFVLENVRHWIGAFHLDGLRLDATQALFDATTPHIIADIAEAARTAAGARKVVIIAENEPQHGDMLLPAGQGGCGLDALWNDDFHHSARVALTGRHEGYLSDYRGRPQELISSVRRGFLFQGQYYHWQKQPRGQPWRSQPAHALVTYLQNHDQVANTFYGQRLSHIADPAQIKAMTALLLLAPQTPLLFMGQEYGATTPFTFFADHKPELRETVHDGRRRFLAQFPSYATEEARAAIPDPAEAATFITCKLDFTERARNAAVYELHKDLLRLRRTNPVIAEQDAQAIEGAVLGDSAFLLRWSTEAGERLLIVNLGARLALQPAPEPLLAPPAHRQWKVAWSSDDPRYGGPGIVSPCRADGWELPGVSAILLHPEQAPWT